MSINTNLHAWFGMKLIQCNRKKLEKELVKILAKNVPNDQVRKEIDELLKPRGNLELIQADQSMEHQNRRTFGDKA